MDGRFESGTAAITAQPNIAPTALPDAVPTISEIDKYHRSKLASGAIIAGAGASFFAATGVALASAEMPTTAPMDAEIPSVEGTSNVKVVEPFRLFDTRDKDSLYGQISAGGTLSFKVAGEGIPENATNVILNVTVAGAGGPGYVTVFPTGDALPDTSNINPERKGQDIANFVMAKVGQGGQVSVFSNIKTDLIVDVLGYTLPVTNPKGTAEGRFEAIPNTRLEDTREGDDVPLTNGSTREIIVASACDPNRYGAIVISLTDTAPTGPGYLQAYSDGQMPTNSNVNFGKGETTSNTVIVPISEGKIKVKAMVASNGVVDTIVDAVGCITGENAEISQNGEYVSLPPDRDLDTRAGNKVQPGEARFVRLKNLGAFAHRKFQALVMNITGNQTVGAGFVTGDNEGNNGKTSILNLVPGQTKAIGTIIPTAVTPNGDYGFYLRPGANEGMSTHLLADVSGGFISDTEPPLTNPPDEAQPGVTLVFAGGDYIRRSQFDFSCTYKIFPGNGADIPDAFETHSKFVTKGLVSDLDPNPPFTGDIFDFVITGRDGEFDQSGTYYENTSYEVPIQTSELYNQLEPAKTYTGTIAFTKYNEATKNLSDSQKGQSLYQITNFPCTPEDSNP
jgi:hypothetical protein